MSLLAWALHAALVLCAAPALAGAPHPAQVWHDLRRLWRKAPVRPQESWLFGAAPVASLGATLAAALLTPSFTLGMATAPLADLVLIAMLFAVARAALVLAGFDAGTSLAGLAGQRMGVLHLVADPGLLVPILIVAAAAGTSNLDLAAAALREGGPHPGVLLAAAGSVIVLVAGMERGGGLLQAFAGRDLALLTFAAQLRLVTLFSVLAAVVLPFGLAPGGSGVEAWVVGAACWALKMVVLGLVTTGLARLRARLRVDRAPELALLGLLLGLLAAALLFAGQRAA